MHCVHCVLQYDSKYDSYKPKYNEKGAKAAASAASTATTEVGHLPGPVMPLVPTAVLYIKADGLQAARQRPAYAAQLLPEQAC
jgi:hypothetical protein